MIIYNTIRNLAQYDLIFIQSCDHICFHTLGLAKYYYTYKDTYKDHIIPNFKYYYTCIAYKITYVIRSFHN